MSGLLPGRDGAVVPIGKVRDYLLNDAHPDGASKSAYFQRFGFSPADAERLAEALALHARTRPVAGIRGQPPFGELFSLDCSVQTPDGRNPCIRTVWLIATDAAPRFVTAYPVPDAAPS